MKKFPPRAVGARLLLALSAALMAAGAPAQDYPARPVRIVHPYPGGPVDASTRVLAERLSAMWKQPVLVDPRPGANEIIAADLVAKAPADGLDWRCPPAHLKRSRTNCRRTSRQC